MKKVNAAIYIMVLLLAAGCSHGYKMALVKTRNVIASNTTHLPLIVDLMVDDTRVNGTFSCNSDYGVEYAKTQAVAVVLKKSNADLLFEPQYLIENTGHTYNVEVSGHPAHYKNFRIPGTGAGPSSARREENTASAPAPVNDYKPVKPAEAPAVQQQAPAKTEAAPPQKEPVKAEPVTAEETKPAVKEENVPLKEASLSTDEPAPVKEAQGSSPQLTFHIVTAGETEASIARDFGITVEDFKGWNYLPDGLKPGQNVVVKFVAAKKQAEVKKPEVKKPEPQAAPDPGGVKYHTVAAGETLYHISVVYHVTVQQIKDWNNLGDNTVSVGQSLVVGK